MFLQLGLFLIGLVIAIALAELIIELRKKIRKKRIEDQIYQEPKDPPTIIELEYVDHSWRYCRKGD